MEGLGEGEGEDLDFVLASFVWQVLEGGLLLRNGQQGCIFNSAIRQWFSFREET